MGLHFDDELAQLKERVLVMGGLAESMIHEAMRALVERRVEYMAQVFAQEEQVNSLHLEIDDRCIKLLALRQPIATDLRTITAAMKVATDLERIGDQAVNIAQTTEFLLKHPLLKPLIDLPRMALIAQEMLKDSLDAFVRRDVELAKQVVMRDDEVDSFKQQIFRELLTYMLNEPSTIQRGLDLILVSRNLERIADHATNVAEDVIFMVEGKDIRHHALDKNPTQ